MSRQIRSKVIAVLFLVMVATGADAGQRPQLVVGSPDGGYRVSLKLGDRVMMQSPEQGLWSLAFEWQSGWPSDWRHARPSRLENVGEWTVLSGSLPLEQGTWKLRDAYRLSEPGAQATGFSGPASEPGSQAKGFSGPASEPRAQATGNWTQPTGTREHRPLLQCVRRWEWDGPIQLDKCTLAVRWLTPATQGSQLLLPGILYNGNPSGARSGRVPTFTGKVGERALFEEHRYPMPFASIEWPVDAGRVGAALHALPCPVPFGNLPDQWWSLGAQVIEDGTELVLLSGPTASNGRDSVSKAVQGGFLPYEHTWLNVKPGAVIEKTFYLELHPVDDEGSGFQQPTRTAIALFEPAHFEDLPSFPEIIQAKYRYARTRYLERDGMAGFRKFPEKDFLVMGWCGQADALGYALPVLKDKLHDPAAMDMARKSLDTLCRAKFYERGFHTWLDASNGNWSGDEPLSQGQAMLSFARAIRVGREQATDTRAWETFLRKACDLHARRILAEDWRPPSTSEAFFIAPLCLASQLFGESLYREAAVKAGQTFADRHLNMHEPYWGGTLDASCEDKEGAFAAFQGFLNLYQLTRDPRMLRWAEHACDVVLTYTMVWDIELPAGRLLSHRFKTRGWTGVSAQNQHLDVFGVLIAPDIYELGQMLKRDDLRQMALLMYRSCGQLIDPWGSQGEQIQQTNYTQGHSTEDLFAMRGGYVEHWTVFWITAHFLNAAARFQELGVPLE